jgi:hypothetical protein
MPLYHLLPPQAKKIIKTQTTMRVEAVEVKPVEEREPWTLPSSIFKPRVKESDARNFFDTPVVGTSTMSSHYCMCSQSALGTVIQQQLVSV